MDSLYNKYKNFGDDALHTALLEACKGNNFDDVRFLLTSNDLKVKLDIHYGGDRALTLACVNGNFDIVKYLLSSSELSEHADLTSDNHYPLIQACVNRHLDIVKYLLTSPDLKEHSDLHVYDDEPFGIAMEENFDDFLHYFIFDLNIPKTEKIQYRLRINPNPKIELMFQNRELIKDLNDNLSNNDTSITKRIKL